MTAVGRMVSRLRFGRPSAAGRIGPELTKREKRLLILGLAGFPAVLALAVVVVMSIMLIGPERSTITWYQQRGRLALAQKDYATARLCYATLLRKRPDDPAVQFGLAQSLAGLGDVGPALATIHKLAPDEGLGYVPAHILLARQYMSDPAATDEALSKAESHLLRVVKIEPKNDEANVLLAGIYAQRKQWDQVGKYLPKSTVGSSLDELALVGAEAAAQRNDQVAMEMWAKRAVSFYATKLKADPKDNESRVRCAQANVMIKEYEKAVHILEEGWNLTKDDSFRRYVAQATGIWLRNSASLDAPRRLALLEQGLSWDGQNNLLLLQILDSKSADAASLVQASTQPVAGAVSRAFVQSIIAARARKPDLVRSELDTAFTVRSDIALPIAANLSTTWAYSKESDAADALSLSTALIAIRPSEAIANRAHGLVLAKVGKFVDAISYLEAGLKTMPQDRALHDALAVCYERTGKPELAAVHRAATQPSATQPATTKPVRSSASPS